jgi:chromate transporter
MTETAPTNSAPMDAATEGGAVSPTSYELFLSFLRLGALAFGGPAMVAYIRDLAVDQKRWLRPAQFRDGVALCQALPGATAMQCAAYVGWRLRGLRGACAAYLGFGLPAVAAMLVLSVLYQQASGLALVAATLVGLRGIVVALMANAAWTFGRASIERRGELALAIVAGAAFLLDAPPLLIVAGSSILTMTFLRRRDEAAPEGSRREAGWRDLLPAGLIAAVAGATVVVALVLRPRLAQVGLVMAKTDIAAFGGGFAALPVMFHEVVVARDWLRGQTFLDGILLGQITPGPIVITATFVGYQIAGYAGALAATLGIFTPSLFVLVLAEPWFQRLRQFAWFRAAVRGALLSFVGLLASVTVRFSLAASWGPSTLLIALGALVALRREVRVVWVVAVGAVVAIAGALLGGSVRG